MSEKRLMANMAWPVGEEAKRACWKMKILYVELYSLYVWHKYIGI